MTDTTDRAEPMKGLAEWLRERRDNARRIADMYRGQDRAGWLEDAAYFQQAINAVEACRQRPAAPAQIERFATALTAIAHTTNHCGSEYTALSETAERVLREILPEACAVLGTTCGVTIQHAPHDIARMFAAPAWPKGNAWAHAVDDARLAHGLDCTTETDDPVKSLGELLWLAEDMALDPAISERARKLMNMNAAPEQAAVTDMQIGVAFHKYGTGRPDGFNAAVRDLLAQSSPPHPSGVDAQWLERAMELDEAVVAAAARETIPECKGGFARAREALRTHLSTALTGTKGGA